MLGSLFCNEAKFLSFFSVSLTILAISIRRLPTDKSRGIRVRTNIVDGRRVGTVDV